ncbi:hypothetical protein H5410_005931 [Solanum commersonii]|uniref:Uncharacterized protein n=1 Tax=Solanum commersonii TaxID=4109 RepID=A0A9J6A884_SOLCO|nr:hypothetical protein H5410_005931 [Solanum commersonii]
MFFYRATSIDFFIKKFGVKLIRDNQHGLTTVVYLQVRSMELDENGQQSYGSTKSLYISLFMELDENGQQSYGIQ